MTSILRKTLGATFAIAALAVTSPAYATLTFTASGKSSKGDSVSLNLNDKLLVKTMATFMFSGASGFTEDNIARTVTFGLGTAPDSTMRVTIPANKITTMTIIQVPESTTMIAGALLLLPFGINTVRVMRKNRRAA